MRTAVTELQDSRARVEVEVDAGDVESRVLEAARAVGKEIRMPGFRKGKVPPELVLQRLGREPVLQQAVEEAMPEWFEQAVLDAEIAPVGDPDLSVEGLPDRGEPLHFTIEIGVRPRAELGEYTGLEVGRREPEVSEEDVEKVLDRLREPHASLEPVEREAREGDHLVIDYRGEIDGEAFEGGEGRGQLVELGSGTLIPGFEEELLGAEAGEQRTVRVTFPDDYGAEHLAGREATFEVTVGAVNEKHLPEPDDDFAQTASEHDTIADLRADIRSKLAEQQEQEIEREFREAAVDAVVERSTLEIPEEIAKARAEEGWKRMERALEGRGVEPGQYLRAAGKTREEVVEEARPEAEQELKREAVLEAVAEAEGIEVSEQDMLEALRDAEGGGKNPERLLKKLRSQGRDVLLRNDLRIRKAVDAVVSSATPIPAERAEAREALWTPEKERAEGEDEGLWTPGRD